MIDKVPPVMPVGVTDHTPPMNRSDNDTLIGVAGALTGPPLVLTSLANAAPPGKVASALTIAVAAAAAVQVYGNEAVVYAVPWYVYVSVKLPAVNVALAASVMADHGSNENGSDITADVGGGAGVFAGATRHAAWPTTTLFVLYSCPIM